MLQSIRDRAQGVFAWVILILISVPFIFWGIENYVTGGREQAVAAVGEKEIFQADVSRAYQEIAARLRSLGALEHETLQNLALKNLVDEEALRQTALERDFAVSDAQVREAIRSIPNFQGDKGFDKEKFLNVLKAQNVSEAYFVERIRKGLMIGQLQEGITKSTFATPSEIERFLDLRDQVRTLEYVTIPTVINEALISPQEIEGYYREHQASFQTPERVSVKYIELSVDELAAKVVVHEDDLKAYYESQKDVYTRKERRKVSHILAAFDPKNAEAGEKAALDKIKQAKARLDRGEDFAKVAEEMSEDPGSAKQGGSLGLINPGEMVPEFETAAYALAPGQLSEPVKSPFGYHLIKVTELEPEQIKPFEEVRAEVEAAYRRQQAENQYYEIGERLEQIAYENPGDLTKAAQDAGLEVKSSDLFSRHEAQGFGADPKIVEAAFSEQVLEGRNSDPIEVSSDRLMFLRLDQHELAATKELAAVSEQIANEIKMKMANEAAAQQADRVLVELKSGRNLSDLAASNNLTVQKPGPIGRNDANLPVELIKALFATNKPVAGKPTPLQTTLADGQHVVGVLLDVQRKKSEQPDTPNEGEQAESWLNTQQGSAEFSDLLAQVKEEIGVEIKEKKDQ